MFSKRKVEFTRPFLFIGKETDMSYKYSKGSQVIGDLKAADDAQGDTLIDFGEDRIDFQTSGSVRLTIENNEITTTVPIHISGSVTEGLRIGKAGNEYREIQFETDGVDTAFIQLDSSEGLVIGCQSDSDEIIFMTTQGGVTSEAMRVRHGAVGIGTISPKTGLDVHHDPTGLATDEGGGEIVKFGSGTLTTGKLYYLNGTAWAEVDADAPATGADQLIGIAMGSSPTTNGLLIRGFFRAHTYLSNFSGGKAVYIDTTAGAMNTTAPSGAGDFVRIVGYCANINNIIYFNPSATWIEL